MFTRYTFQDWQEQVANGKQEDFILAVISAYKSSDDFKTAKIAEGYYSSEKTEIDSKVVLQAKKITVHNEKDNTNKSMMTNQEIVGNRIASNFFRRFVNQENSFLLGNGVTLADEGTKKKLGTGFDKHVANLGKRALIDGVSWGFWNNDHLEEIPAYTDALSGAVSLLDEMSSEPGVFIQFWQLEANRPQYIRLFETDGMTMYKYEDNKLEIIVPKRAYVLKIAKNAIQTEIVGEENYNMLPVIPLYANGEKRSELTKSLKSKIDLYDRIASDFGDNLDRANEVYWVLNNFGGSISDVCDTLEQIQKLKAVINMSDGTGNASTAEPHTIEVPYQARQTALSILKKEMYSDAMALDMDELTGGSLTNVAIKAAMTNLNLKCDDFEWEVFSFVQKVLRLIGIETEEIKFKRRELVNDAEIVQSVQQMAGDLDLRTRLKLYPYIEQDEIDGIIEALDAETVSGMPSVEDLQQEITRMKAQNPEETQETQQENTNTIDLSKYSPETREQIMALLK